MQSGWETAAPWYVGGCEIWGALGPPLLDCTWQLTLSHLLSSDQGSNLGPRHGKLRVLTTVHQGSLILGVYCWGEVGPRMALIGFISGSLRDAPCLIRCVELVLNTRREVPFWGRSVGKRLRKFPPCGMDSLIFFFFKDKGPPLGQLPSERPRQRFGHLNAPGPLRELPRN